jgi:hypothetical protein
MMVYYFCMVYEGVHPDGSPEMVHCTGEKRPYVTLNRNGLALTRHHSSMYAYTPGSNIARYIPDGRRLGNICGDVTLRPDQVEMLDLAISTKYFFD